MKRHRFGDFAVTIAVTVLGLVVMAGGWMLVKLHARRNTHG